MKRIDDNVHQDLTDGRLVTQNGRQRVLHSLFETDLPLFRLELHQRHDVLDHAPELPRAIWVTHDETVEHDRHDQWASCRFREHFIELVDEVVAPCL